MAFFIPMSTLRNAQNSAGSVAFISDVQLRRHEPAIIQSHKETGSIRTFSAPVANHFQESQKSG
jgi:hypothetical protein